MRVVLAAVLLAVPAAFLAAPLSVASDCAATSTGLEPLNDLGAGTHNGFQGGLYPGGSNARPATHTALGEAVAALAVPRDLAGNPDPLLGRSVFLSVGMSNTRSIFGSFLPLAGADAYRDPRVVAVNGALGGMDADSISSPASMYWVQVDQILIGAGLSPLQVQAAWLYEALAGPSGAAVPDHAEVLEGQLRAIVQSMKLHFPNLLLVYLSSREYAGYASTGLNPEPYAHASGFSVKWLIESQLQSPAVFASAADPAHGVVMPWLSWGPYTWADGLRARSDGLSYACSDFAADGTHPNPAGARKVAQQLLDFLHADSVARVWYHDAGLQP